MSKTKEPDGSGRSPNASLRYQELVCEANHDPIRIYDDFELTEAEVTWCEITAREEEVFGIDARLVHALALAWMRYQDMIGCTDTEFSEWRDEERRAFPEFFKGECAYSIDAAIGFMVAACRLPFTQALLWVCRSQVQYVRSGLMCGDRPSPAWAYGVTEAGARYLR